MIERHAHLLAYVDNAGIKLLPVENAMIKRIRVQLIRKQTYNHKSDERLPLSLWFGANWEFYDYCCKKVTYL
jgi:hypothetical protein